MAVQVGERLAVRGAVDDLARVIPQGVVEGDDLVLRDARVGSCVKWERARTRPRYEKSVAKRARIEGARRIPLRPARGLTMQVRRDKS